MNLRDSTSKALCVLALAGCAIIFANLLWQVYGMLEWGVTHQWHFKNLLGWGFGWLVHVELHVLALILVVPFWALVTKRASLQPLPGRRFINSAVAIGLLTFLFLTMLEAQLQKAFP